MALADPSVHRFSSAEYDALCSSGVLAELKVELVDGLILEMTQQGPEHAMIIRTLTRLLAGRADLLAIQLPLRVLERWTPEPDVALAEMPGDAHPDRAHLAVEVVVHARSEARRKMPGYVRAGIPQAWFVDVPARLVEVHRPDGSIEVRSGHDLLDPEVEGIVPFAVSELFARLQRT